MSPKDPSLASAFLARYRSPVRLGPRYHFIVRGKNLKPNLVEQAVRLTHEKYCSATAMLAKSAEITKDFEIVEA